MTEAARIIDRLLITEKANEASSHFNKYFLKVHPKANRIEVAHAVEAAFPGVQVGRVNILNVKPKIKPQRFRRGRAGSKPGFKKAIVTLKKGTIDLL